jgi:hypothetical protein
MLPAHERLRRHHPAGGQLDLKLVVGHQLTAAAFPSMTTGSPVLHTVTISHVLS